jgi:hypothetical protein
MIDMRHSGMSIVDIAQKLKRSYSSIRTKLCKIGIVKPTTWDDPALTERVVELRKAGDKHCVIAAELGLSDNQVRGRLEYLRKKGLM